MDEPGAVLVGEPGECPHIERAAGIDQATPALGAETVTQVLQVMAKNVAKAREVIRHAAGAIAPPRSCACPEAAKHAIMTDPAAIPAEVRKRLEVVMGRHLL